VKLAKNVIMELFEIAESEDPGKTFCGWGAVSLQEISAWKYGTQYQLVVYDATLLTFSTKEKVRYWAIDIRCTDDDGPRYEWDQWHDNADLDLYEVTPVPQTRIIYPAVDTNAYDKMRHD
jgi:hypothetical protein